MKLHEAVMTKFYQEHGHQDRTFNDLTNEELIELISESVGEIKTTRGLGTHDDQIPDDWRE